VAWYLLWHWNGLLFLPPWPTTDPPHPTYQHNHRHRHLQRKITNVFETTNSIPCMYPQIDIPSLTPCQYIFLKITPKITPENLTLSLERAWNDDPNTTLKLIFHLGLAPSMPILIKMHSSLHFFGFIRKIFNFSSYVFLQPLLVLGT
jgi:hypothetical protein